MRNTMLVFVILGLVASVNCVCDTIAVGSCAATLTLETTAAVFDTTQLCSAKRKYKTCISNAGCSSDGSDTAAINAANLLINESCGGAMVTASVFTMILTLFAMLFK
ncbi:uncharacterized protein LOC121380072 [Gigantopelta aegis]|uniref:uncharacterized protein LOC121380072 n=1 Tax=Gigantopelta aegis TaxID=1735272 RepID=UPI001B88B4A9|nr:uncharacterized protein LOC121380072 [Gigantopelta aegis]XP_041364756.1 uncharacterized protein LOC121380072 [Gigantopelta aegis]